MAHIQQVSMESTDFKPRKTFALVDPQELDRGEKVTESGLVISLKQNTSSIDRPSSGYLVAVGDEIEEYKEGDFVCWAYTDGIDMEFFDGPKVLIRYESILGMKK